MRWTEITEAAEASETWTRVVIFGEEVWVGWSNAKDRRNRARHLGLSLGDGIPVLQDPGAKGVVQYRAGEEREQIVGHGRDRRLLFVAVEWLDDTGEALRAVRIISVRAADARDLNTMGITEDRDMQGNSASAQSDDPENPPLPAQPTFYSWRDRFVQRGAARKLSAKSGAEPKAKRTPPETSGP